MGKLTLRFAGETESGLILEYIKKLDDYENRLNEFTATEKDTENRF